MSITQVVKATREGEVGQETASGYIIDRYVLFVALPSTNAVKPLPRSVRVTNPANGKSVIAQVLDVGPWNEHDDAYVFGAARPQAESGIDISGRITNHAGIDLGEAVWNALGMIDNAEVSWEFVE